MTFLNLINDASVDVHFQIHVTRFNRCNKKKEAFAKKCRFTKTKIHRVQFIV